MMRSVAFREKNEKYWKKLEFLLAKVEKKGHKNLKPDELTEIMSLYRQTCSSFYLAKSISLDKNLHSYLENLVMQGYLAIYCSKPVDGSQGIRFFMVEFPQLFRKYILYFCITFLVLISSIFISYMAVQKKPEIYSTFVAPQISQGRTPYSSKEELKRTLEEGRKSKMDALGFFATYLFTHNTWVGFLTFALGVFFGLTTLYLLFQNGAMLGAMSYAFHTKGLALDWWAWILPHGITEFLAILICSTAGLILGHALIQSGPYGRMYELKEKGKDAGKLVMGTILLFLIAGLIEGFFRQSHAPKEVRYLLALATFVWWVYYFGYCGRGLSQ